MSFNNVFRAGIDYGKVQQILQNWRNWPTKILLLRHTFFQLSFKSYVQENLH